MLLVLSGDLPAKQAVEFQMAEIPLWMPGPTLDSVKERTRPHIAWIVLDGVRRKEAYFPASPETDSFPHLRRRMKKGEVLTFGNPADGEEMRVSNTVAKSLPGYQAMLTGRDPSATCRGNSVEDCPRQEFPTIFDRLVSEGEGGNRLASVASWSGLDRAVTQAKEPSFFHTSSGQDLLQNQDFSPLSREALEALVQRSRQDLPPWKNSVKDAYAFAMGRAIWRAWHPRLQLFQWVDSDEWAHLDRYANYVTTLRAYDEWIEEMIQTADIEESAGRWGPTVFIITTDHGRGEGQKLFLDRFPEHGDSHPSSYRHWAWIRVPQSMRGNFQKAMRADYQQADLRPTIETLLGLEPPADLDGKSLVLRQ